MGVHIGALIMASLVLLASTSSNKYCKYCCERDRAWDSKRLACANGGSYIKIHDNCGVEGRRRRAKQRICCDKLNAFHSCSQPAPAPAPTPSPSSAAPTPPPATTPT